MEEHMKKLSGQGIAPATAKPRQVAGHLHHARYNLPRP
ncbi:hypothetical protein DVDV_1634 [Desulfovibrio sp. DV]|nr:hypothetical protein DVDV_1634 [Desulfovibrio sp. DV]